MEENDTLKNTVKEKDIKIADIQPKVNFANAVATSHTSILVGDLAKLLKQNGVDIGANRMFERLRENGYLIKRRGADWNMPTQKSMNLGLFEIKESTVNNPDGSVRINKTPKVTGYGQQYFINIFLVKDDQKA
jgi:anti-repressor protein